MKYQNTILIVVIMVLCIGVIKSSHKKTVFLNEEPAIEITIKDTNTNELEKIDLESYIIGVVAGEMPALFNEEALKAQAIAARTYAVYKMSTSQEKYALVTDVSNQVFLNEEKLESKWKENYLQYYNKIKKCVDDTKGLIMTYKGDVIESFYFALSNGYTEDVSMVFGEKIDYLKSVESSWDKNLTGFLVTKNFSKEEFCEKLQIDCSNISIEKEERTKTNRIKTILINGKEFKGTEVRKLLNLRSTDFDILVDNEIVINTRGYGHGVGMSQYGANEMAKQGLNYEQILKYYYQNIEIEKINV